MIYKGNYSNWIQHEWIEYMLNNVGYSGPGGKVPENEYEEKGKTRITKAGYDWDSTLWEIFDESNLPFTIEPPVERIKSWWIVKQLPGQLMPMHGDHDDDEATRTTQWWMPLQDYVSGHVFIYQDKLYNEYKSGDLYMFDNVQAFHGSCNIGFTPRLTLNIIQDTR